ncbi:MAG TPA: PAS domain S-box protein [Candidatus Binatia bacterium]|jgi:two-component system cell cycle sensor histidine kinase/response regulator CckA|nr:PAS domain S-box protein [Candidatus Binatia bacterium]
MANPLRVLVVEDSVEDTFFIVRELQRGGFQVDFERVETHASLEVALEAQNWDLLISDYSMPQFSGPAALALYLQKGQDAPFIIVSGAIGEDRAVELVKSGAQDYVMKNNLPRLVPAVKRELRAAQERRIRRQTEASMAYLASIVQSSDDAIIGKTLDGTIVSWNAGAERLYGYSAIEVIGHSISLLFPPYRPEELSEILEQIRSGRAVERLETVRLRKDSTPVEVSVTISPIRDHSGRIIGASSIARDITDHKQQENERLALIQELTAALSHSQAPLAQERKRPGD